MQQCLLSIPMEYKSTFPSTPFSLKHRELAKIQHHVRMDHTTCNNERYRMKNKISHQKIRNIKQKQVQKTF